MICEDFEAALVSLGEAYIAEDVLYELAFAEAEEHRLSTVWYLMGSDYKAVPLRATVEGFETFSHADKIVLPIVHKHFMVHRHV